MNFSKKYRVVGVMSGTSLDGVDFCFVEFQMKKKWRFKILHAETIAYSPTWKKNLQQAHLLSANQLQDLNEKYSLFLSSKIATYVEQNQIDAVDFVASHGHTVLHHPKAGVTLQIGNLPSIANCISVPVVCDFRVQDVQLGGQGAPLVPIGDELLFGKYDYCLNLGGFANISQHHQNHRIAFDICPVNIVLNFFAEKLGYEFDKNGEIARINWPDEKLLYELNQLAFYELPHPKSLGKEWVEEVFLPLVEKYTLPVEIVISTLTHHAAEQISKVIQAHSTVLVTGGGAFNAYLISLIQEKSSAQLILPSTQLINFKEALIFAFLGVLKKRNEINVLASVTGASNNHSSGVIHLPK